jgi:hypothetical protein
MLTRQSRRLRRHTLSADKDRGDIACAQIDAGDGPENRTGDRIGRCEQFSVSVAFVSANASKPSAPSGAHGNQEALRPRLASSRPSDRRVLQQNRHQAVLPEVWSRRQLGVRGRTTEVRVLPAILPCTCPPASRVFLNLRRRAARGAGRPMAHPHFDHPYRRGACAENSQPPPSASHLKWHHIHVDVVARLNFKG